MKQLMPELIFQLVFWAIGKDQSNNNQLWYGTTNCCHIVKNNNYRLLQWHHNECNGMSNHRHLNCLLNLLFNCKSKKHLSSMSLAFVRGIHWWLVYSPHKEPVMQKMFSVDVILLSAWLDLPKVLVICYSRYHQDIWHKCSRLLTQAFIQALLKQNIKVLHHWPLCGEFTGDRWIPLTKGQLRGKCFHLMMSSCQ